MTVTVDVTASSKGLLMKARPALVIGAMAIAVGVLPLRGASAGADHLVEMKGVSFVPEEIQIAVGDSLTWVNQDEDKHDPASKTGEFDSPTLQKGQTFTVTFDQPDTIQYFCKVHTYMQGQIVVGDGKRPEGAPPKRPATTAPNWDTTTTTGFPPEVVPYPSAVTP